MNDFLKQSTDVPTRITATRTVSKTSYSLKLGTEAPLPSRIELVSVIKNNLSLIEDGLEFLEGSLSVISAPPLDILARDGDKRLVVIDVFDGSQIEWLIYALHHHHWVDENKNFFSAIFSPPEISFKLSTRFIAVVTSVPPPVASALAIIKGIGLELYRARCVSLGGEVCIVLEDYFARKKDVASKPRDERREISLEPVRLTEGEVADFLSEVKSEDEITERVKIDAYNEHDFGGHYFNGGSD